jgi:phage gpG-like protein
MKAVGDTNALLKSLQKETEKNAKAFTAPNRKTGNLQRSIVNGPRTATTAVVLANANYAASMEYGSKPHIIVPKSQRQRFAGPFQKGQKGQNRGGVLAWGGPVRLSGRRRSGGKATNFATIVHHPGNKPYPFLMPGAKKAVEGLDDLIAAQWNGAA